MPLCRVCIKKNYRAADHTTHINKMKRPLKIAVLVCLLAFGFFAFKSSDKYFEIAKNLDIFITLFEEVNAYYVDEISPTQLINVGINEMLKSLDPYTNFIPEDQVEDYMTMSSGEYGGIGITVDRRNGKIIVLMPNEGYAASRAGIRIGDQIIAIDGRDVRNSPMEEINDLLRGQSASELTLSVARYGEKEPIELKMKREKIHLKNVPYLGMVTAEVGLIKLQHFTQNAHQEVKEALKTLKQQGAKKIIIDLRHNPGGLLHEAVGISNIFLEKGLKIVDVKGKVSSQNMTYETLEAPKDTQIPLAVLINENSASASEIVAGVVQDYDRGVVVGQQSFGKGLVQISRPLSYNAKLKITVAKYYIPSGRCIQEIDYSNAQKHPLTHQKADSLKKVFYTKNKRAVYEGGGIMPDITTKAGHFASITSALIGQGLLFEYAAIYRYENKEIPEAKNFKLSEEEYKKFLKWLKTKDYDYQNKTEALLKIFIDSAKSEPYFNEIRDEINRLETKVMHNEDVDLLVFKEEIKQELERKIATHFYLQKGEIEATFDDDTDLLAALEILNDSIQYQKILQGTANTQNRKHR